MAEFCSQCSIFLFGIDNKDFADLSDPEDTEAGKYPVVLCEGCGPIQVDHLGRRVSEDFDRCGDCNCTPKTSIKKYMKELRESGKRRSWN